MPAWPRIMGRRFGLALSSASWALSPCPAPSCPLELGLAHLLPRTSGLSVGCHRVCILLSLPYLACGPASYENRAALMSALLTT